VTTTVNNDAARARATAEAAREAGWSSPSFAREMFLGRLRPDLLWPPPAVQLDERGEAFLRDLEEFLVHHVDPELIEREDRIPDEVVKGLRELGAFGMKVDREHGGLGLSTVGYNRALELAASAHSSIAVLLSAHQSIGVPQPLKLFGTEDQKQRFLPRVAAGAISAFLLTEPDVGSDPARLTATAEPTPDGSAYVLNGNKLWTTNGVVAELLVVMATVPPSEGHPGGITAFVVEAASPGITVLRRNSFMGLRGIENGVTRFEDVRVPAEDRIGEEGEGLKIALRTLNTGRLSVPATCAAAAKASLKIAREWCEERVQWGKPVGEHEAVAAKLAQLATTAYALEAMVEVSSALADAGETDIRIEAALAKLYASEAAWDAADTMVQIRGGRGYEKAASLAARGERPVPAEQILRDLRINRIFEGSTEIMHLLIAREAVDQHLTLVDPVLHGEGGTRRTAAVEAGRFYARWLPSLLVGPGQSATSYGEWGPLATHVRFAERACRRLARQTVYGMAKWREDMENRQLYLGRLVDIGAELFAVLAVCVRARAAGPEDLPVADLFCRQARLRVDDLFRSLHRNTDGADIALAKRVMADELTHVEDGILDLTGDLPLVAVPDDAAPQNLHRAV
jgi:alkylation response protein AidB-like acyl-CoA dehydrogenase